eukprot:TRINITY_DN12077_c0_g5_i1.p2 TRINITY_DN12077_c0_g5~~TRINITY_DN12077_c0_g5_i1.p2  ORF type:complete len:143 (-),score=27.96 TRINITY_DN12077_c0_g5_i1:227-655(-)
MTELLPLKGCSEWSMRNLRRKRRLRYQQPNHQAHGTLASVQSMLTWKGTAEAKIAGASSDDDAVAGAAAIEEKHVNEETDTAKKKEERRERTSTLRITRGRKNKTALPKKSAPEKKRRKSFHGRCCRHRGYPNFRKTSGVRI